MTFRFKKVLLSGAAIATISAFAVTEAIAAERTSAGSVDWNTLGVDVSGADADSLTFGANDTITVAPNEDIGTTTTNSLNMSVDTRTSTGTVVIDGGGGVPAGGTIFYGAVGNSDDFGNGNAATIEIGTGAGNNGGTLTIHGNVATGTIINIQTGTGTGTLTLGDGSTASTVGANIDLDAGAAGDGDTILNLNGTTVTGTLTDTGADNGAAGIVINVDDDSSLDGDVTLDTATSVVVDDSQTLSVGAATFNIGAASTVVLGNATTAGATLVLDGTGAQAVTGLVDGDADNLSTVSITNTGGTVTFNQDIGVTNVLGNFTLAANSTVNTAGELRSQTVTINSGATLNADGDILGNVANTGTLDISSGAAAVTGNITGSTGTLNVTGTAEVDGNVTQNTAAVSNGQVFSISGDTAADDTTANITTVTLGDADSGLTLDAANGQTLAFTGAISGAGDVVFGVDAGQTENFTVSGNIGSSATAIDDITVGGGTSTTTATLNGGVWADAVTVNAGDTLNVRGTTNVFDDLLGTGTVVLGDGTDASQLTIGDNATGALTALTVSDNATLIAQNNISATTFTMDGTITVQGASGSTWTGTTTIGGDGAATLNANSQITLGGALNIGNGAGDTFDFNIGQTDNLDPTAAAAIAAGGNTITFVADTVTTLGLSDAQGTASIDSGDTVLWVTGANLASDFDGAIGDGRIVFEDGLLVYTSNSTDTQLSATVTYADAASAFEAGSSGAGVANYLVGLGSAGGNATLQGFRSSLLAAGSTSAQESFAESIAPEVDGAVVVGLNNASNLSVGTTNTRIASLRTGSTETGMVAGEMDSGTAFWSKAFGQIAEQDRREGVAGYDADTYGFAVGIDSSDNMDDSLIGFSFSYANTEVDSEGTNDTQTDINSYQVALYGSQHFANDTYFSGQLGYAWNDIDQQRRNVAGTAGNTARADYDSDQFLAYAEFGQDIEVDRVMTFSPRVLANYQNINIEDYTETGSTANLTVDNDNLNILEFGVGATIDWDLKHRDGSVLRPTVNAEYRYDVMGDEVETTSNFTAGGGSFKTKGFDPAQSSFNVGAGLEYETTNNWAFSADYNYNFKEDYGAHSAQIRASYKF